MVYPPSPTATENRWLRAVVSWRFNSMSYDRNSLWIVKSDYGLS
jgi:hypothetical protein